MYVARLYVYNITTTNGSDVYFIYLAEWQIERNYRYQSLDLGLAGNVNRILMLSIFKIEYSH